MAIQVWTILFLLACILWLGADRYADYLYERSVDLFYAGYFQGNTLDGCELKQESDELVARANRWVDIAETVQKILVLLIAAALVAHG